MNELYWITRFDSLNTIGVVMTIFSIVLFITLWLISISTDDWTGKDCYSEEQKQKLRKGARYSIITFLIGLLLWVFIPTQNEALLIYGVGGTIDYIKSNPTAKQLPDKCINALDKWVDTWNKDSIN